MPAQQGEVPLLTLFADVHYIFSPPHVKPPHDRFSKSSYVYLYHNPMQGRGRLEVANHAGTPEQDAFSGYLDSVRVERSHKHPTLFTIIVETPRGYDGSPPQQDPSQWHLPAPDHRNEGRYMYRLHTVDLYFWTVEDSTMFLDSLRRVLHESQLRLLDAPTSPVASGAEQRDSTVSPVVQKLEQAAISDPYQGRHSMSTTQSFPGPPSAPTPAQTHPASPPPQQQQQPVEAPTDYAPIAYNPAAPAAPEKFAHREPTPPPPDAEHGTGLAAAATHDHGHQQFAAPPLQHQGSFPQQQHQHQQQQQQPYMPGPPQQQGAHSFSPPPAQGTPVGIQRTSTHNSFPPPPPQTFSPPPPHTQHGGSPSQAHLYQNPQGGSPAQGFPYQNAPGAVPTQQQYGGYAGSPGQPHVQSPGFPPVPANKPTQSPGQAPTPGYGHQQSPGMPPPGGYSQYNYGAPNSQPQNPYGAQQQVYRPTEAENATHKPQQANPNQKPSRFDTGAKKFEKGVSGFLKKLDKKF